MDAALVDRLSRGEGWALLSALPPYDEATSLSLQESLREAGFDAELVAAAMTQSRLRARAVDKFGDFAGGMLFTTDGLEQATRLPIAARHAQRYAAADVSLVHDLGCGLGSDAMALSSLEIGVRAVDADPATARVAAVNLRHWPSAAVVCARAEEVDLAGGGTAGDSRARRLARPRTTRERGRRRPWTHETGLLARCHLPLVGRRCSRWPGRCRPPGPSSPPRCPTEPCRPAPRPSGRRGTGRCSSAPSGGARSSRQPDAPPRSARRRRRRSSPQADAAPAHGHPGLTSVHDLGEWLYEPDRAVIRAGLTGALVAALDGAELATGVGYVTAARARELPWARRYRIVEAMPLSTKRLARWLRDQGHDRVTIKKRGVTLDADVLRRQLKMTGRGKGGSEATLVLTRVGGSQVALVVSAA